jgi:hypothetical protein
MKKKIEKAWAIWDGFNLLAFDGRCEVFDDEVSASNALESLSDDAKVVQVEIKII